MVWRMEGVVNLIVQTSILKSVGGKRNMSDTENPAKGAEGTTKQEPSDGGSNTITIRVKEQAGEETYFKVKKTTKMSKVFDAFAQRKGVSRGALRFLLDGDRIKDDQTPEDLDLDQNDQIDCLLEQTGGF
mmetsp:Transcript_26863/g.43227  ORF Transcript_26863/g.43227 Transcript_26863/m.43227 type:complete len:130 (+) Transcript_26863:2-391(+)